MAGHKGFINRTGVDMTPATEIQMLRIVAGTNHAVVLKSIMHMWDILGSENPIEVIFKWDPSTAGSNGTGVTIYERDKNDGDTTFDTAAYQDASGASGWDHTLTMYIGPGGLTELPEATRHIKAGGILDIFYKQKTGGDANLKGGILVEFED